MSAYEDAKKFTQNINNKIQEIIVKTFPTTIYTQKQYDLNIPSTKIILFYPKSNVKSIIEIYAIFYKIPITVINSDQVAVFVDLQCFSEEVVLAKLLAENDFMNLEKEKQSFVNVYINMIKNDDTNNTLKALDLLCNSLNGNWLVGDDFCLLDIYVYWYLQSKEEVKFRLNKHEHLIGWVNRVSEYLNKRQ